jgi:hypothetical protein
MVKLFSVAIPKDIGFEVEGIPKPTISLHNATPKL